MASESMTAADYIKHHLESLTSLSDVTKGQGLKNIADFSFINIDAIFFAVVLGALGCLIEYGFGSNSSLILHLMLYCTKQ